MDDNSQSTAAAWAKGLEKMNSMSKLELQKQQSERFDYIRYLIRCGKSATDINKLVAERFNISISMASKVKQRFRKEQKARKEERELYGREDLIIVLEGQLEDCISEGDRQNLLKTIQILSKVGGYDAPLKIETKQEVAVFNNLDALSVDELVLLKQLEEKAGAVGEENVEQ